MGMKTNTDLVSADPTGFGFYQLTQKNARRSSTAQAFLKPAMAARANLTVLLNTMTKRIVLEGKQAVGIAIVGRRGETIMRAAREVIVSSGAIGSPKLLQLSGIGPREELVESRHRHAAPPARRGQQLAGPCGPLHHLRMFRRLHL